MKKEIKKETKKIVKNNSDICKDIAKLLDNKYPQQTIDEIIRAGDQVIKEAMIHGIEVKKAGLFSTKITHVKARKFLSINSKVGKDGKQEFSISPERKRVKIKISKDINSCLNGDKKALAKIMKAPSKTPTKTTTAAKAKAKPKAKK